MNEERCKHEWVYDSKILLSNPPMRDRICRKCGKVERISGEYYDNYEFQRIEEKFKGIKRR